MWKILLICMSLIVIIETTIGPRTLKQSDKKKKNDPGLIGPQKQTVHDRGLVVKKVAPIDILHNHRSFHEDVDTPHFSGTVLGYVTPWNNHGYDLAKIFGNKFTHISPVWLQIKRLSPGDYEIKGIHDIDKKWMNHVKNAGRERQLRIVPRLLYDEWTVNDFNQMLTSTDEIDIVVDLLTELCENYKFGGLVMEIWTQLITRIPEYLLINFIKHLGETFKSVDYHLILVVPPKREDFDYFTTKHFDELFPHVHAFSLMTYDYSNPFNPGPNAPINWVEDSIKLITMDDSKRYKILTGLNFYGNDYIASGGGPIINSQYLDNLNKTKGNLKYDDEMGEHYFEYKDANGRHLVFYPTLYSLYRRIKLCQNLGTGLSIWELGQGLDYFYDLL